MWADKMSFWFENGTTTLQDASVFCNGRGRDCSKPRWLNITKLDVKICPAFFAKTSPCSVSNPLVAEASDNWVLYI